MSNLRWLSVLFLAGLWSASAFAVSVITFDNLPIEFGAYWNDTVLHSSEGVVFNNDFVRIYDEDWDMAYELWSGFAFSNVDDVETPGFENQFAAYSGTDASGNGNYAVVYDANNQAYLTLNTAMRVRGFYAVNTTYAAHSMRDGDWFSKAFEPGDWFKLTVTGYDEDDYPIGSVEFYLADYRHSDPSEHYILDDWTWVDLTALCVPVSRLSFSLSSSDVGDWGMNTPAYFAMDDLTLDISTGPFAPAAGQPCSTAISMHDDRIVGWATGWTNYVPGANVSSDFMTPEKALGPATSNVYDVVSQGDGGSIVMTFDPPIANGPGYDFAVFGNAFTHTEFLELAYVEVSSDGTNFVRFPNHSLTPAGTYWDEDMDPTLINGLAGKYMKGFGVPFDLHELRYSDVLDIHNVPYVRLVDIIGDGSYEDSYGNPIYDPTPSIFPGFSGGAGFDLEAVAVLNQRTPLHVWRVESFGEDAYAPLAANDADWSGDGIPNLLAFALRLDPTQEHVEPLFHLVPESDGTGRWVEIEYTRRAGFTNLRLAVNTDLLNGAWINGPATVTEEVEVLEDEETERIRVWPNGTWADADMLFFRLEVVEP